MAVVGGASMVVQGLAKIAAVTPSTRDDEVIGKVQAFLVWPDQGAGQAGYEPAG